MAYLYFAKLNVNNDIFKVYNGEEDIEKILNKLIVRINSKKILSLPKNKEYIKFIALTSSIEKRFVRGRLIKIFEDDFQMYNSKTDDLEELPQSALARTSTFYCDVQHELIAFTVGKYFSPKQFCDYFEQLINQCTEEGNFNVTLLKDTDSFEEKVKKFSKITSVTFKIVPKNPCYDEFDKLYANLESMESMQANRLEVTYTANNKNNQGINLNNDYFKNFKKSLELGYIKSTVTGLIAGVTKGKVFSDQDAPKRFIIPNNDQTSIPNVHEHAKTFIPQILLKMLGKK